MIRQFFGYIGEILYAALVIGMLLLCFGIFVKELVPFWPVFSLLAFIGMTSQAWEGGRHNRALCLAGIAVYISGWVVARLMGSMVGPIVGSAVCAAGFLIWFQAFLYSAFGPSMAQTRSWAS